MPDNETLDRPVSPRLSDNYRQFEALFRHCSDIQLHIYRYGSGLEKEALAIFSDVLIDEKDLFAVKTVFNDAAGGRSHDSLDVDTDAVIRFFERHGVPSKRLRTVERVDSVVRQVMDGDIVVLFEGWSKALCFEVAVSVSRAISESITEPVVRGPHDSTIEDLKVNLGMLRKKMGSHKFKLVSIAAGGECRTRVVYGYHEDKVNPETLKEFETRVQAIKEIEVLETSYVEEMIEDYTYSPFPQYRITERTDVAVASLLEGKIIVLVSGTPSIMICPGKFVEMFVTSEDYYSRTLYASMIRILRVGAFFIALTLPSMYIAISTFHSELFPTVLLLAILETREGIPFPALIEAFLMECLFELLREAGIRLPRPVGSAVSIVGALVIGQAAIQAKIASPIMVIVVALTGIASFSIPQYNIAVSLRILRFPLMLLAGTMGGFGLMIGLLLIQLHLTTMRSLGQPYLEPLAPLRSIKLRNVLVRAPLKTLLRGARSGRMPHHQK